jgi:hypothetical protein
MEFVLSRRNGLMTRVGVFVRLLMLVACLVPFTSPRQAAAALAPTPPAAPVPATPTPAPVQEEEDEGRQGQANRPFLLIRDQPRRIFTESPALSPIHFGA